MKRDAQFKVEFSTVGYAGDFSGAVADLLNQILDGRAEVTVRGTNVHGEEQVQRYEVDRHGCARITKREPAEKLNNDPIRLGDEVSYKRPDGSTGRAVPAQLPPYRSPREKVFGKS